MPRSRTNPQYNEDVLGDELRPWQIGYERIAGLGGLRGKSKTVPPEVNAFWQNQSFHNYADYALSPEFERGLEELEKVAAERPTAIMCAEAVWWRCHRRIIADYLLTDGREVLHLMGQGRACWLGEPSGRPSVPCGLCPSCAVCATPLARLRPVHCMLLPSMGKDGFVSFV